jgi:alkylhydroperoxidase family enzyme
LSEEKGENMSRIQGVEPENASPEVRALYDKFEAADFQILNVIKMFANNEHFLAGMFAFASGIYFHGKLSPRYRELAYLRASQLNSCHY